MSDLQTGQELPPRCRTATLETLVRYAGAAGDFYPMHYDLEAARRQGHADLSLHGLLKAAWLHDYVAEWADGVADVEELVAPPAPAALPMFPPSAALQRSRYVGPLSRHDCGC